MHIKESGKPGPGDISEEKIMEWVDHMKANNVKRVITLMDANELEWYQVSLMDVYKREMDVVSGPYKHDFMRTKQTWQSCSLLMAAIDVLSHHIMP